MTKKINLRIAVAAVILLLAAPVFAEDRTVGWVTGVDGKVTIDRARMGSTFAMLGMGLEVGDHIRTETSARLRVLFVEDTILTISNDTELSIATFRYSKAMEGKKVLIDLQKGRVKVLTPKQPDSAGDWKMTTPNAVISALGTSFVVEFDPQKDKSSICVTEGLVGVSAKDKGFEGVFHVSGGEMTFVKKGRYPELPVDATKEQVAFYEKIFIVSQPTDLSKIPGRSGNLVDNPKKGLKKMPMFSSYSDSFSAQSEGEGGAEFDAYLANEPLEDTDLPYGAETSKVNISVDFKEEPED